MFRKSKIEPVEKENSQTATLQEKLAYGKQEKIGV